MAETSAGELDTVESWVDGVAAGLVRGWAWRPAHPGRCVEIEVVAGERVLALGRADLQRADLAAAGKGEGACGFAIPIELDGLEGTKVDLVVRAKDGAALRNGLISIDVAGSRGPADTASPEPSHLPIRLGDGIHVRGYLEHFGPTTIGGWIARAERPSDRIELEIWDADRVTGRITADRWRTDLAELHQGDGRGGFNAPIPLALADGERHTVDLRLAGTSILPQPLVLQFPVRNGGDPEILLPRSQDIDDSRAARSRPLRHVVPAGPLFTIIVVFHNMRREAERTLTSLTRAYQRGIGDLPYEVLCVDNGSTPPLDADWVRGFGPEFRLIRPVEILPSPCRAINEAAAQAKGCYLAAMIDGAHVLTPGVFREVWDAFEEAPEAVVAIRQWFVGGDQRWLASVGYSTTQEDMLFDKIGWPNDGYLMFKIGTPIWESPHFWFAGIIESNCLFLPRALYERIGGFNEAFSEPGAGYANLDLFRRAAAAVEEPVIALVGEASFHQFHGGTTTNVSDEEKERRVRQYESNYVRIQGENFSGVKEPDIRLRGQHRVMASILARSRPLSPGRLGVTDRVRPGNAPLHLGEMTTDYLRSAYAECGLSQTTRWLGHELSLAPPDVLAIQEIIYEQRPDAIVAVNVEAGVIRLADSVLQLVGLSHACIVQVGRSPIELGRVAAHTIVGDARAPATLTAVTRALGAAEKILVLFAPTPGDDFPADVLRAYARFVSPRSYLVFLGSVFGQPWLGYSRHWFAKAIRVLVEGAPFAIDETRTRHLITTCPMGYLQRIGNFDPPDEDADVVDLPVSW
jgi:cephalosporin hydroxylase/GT2 family glycosyltransferase